MSPFFLGNRATCWVNIFLSFMDRFMNFYSTITQSGIPGSVFSGMPCTIFYSAKKQLARVFWEVPDEIALKIWYIRQHILFWFHQVNREQNILHVSSIGESYTKGVGWFKYLASFLLSKPWDRWWLNFGKVRLLFNSSLSVLLFLYSRLRGEPKRSLTTDFPCFWVRRVWVFFA